jgi:hypothetical protein
MLSKRFLIAVIIACAAINSHAARLKIYEYPKQISGGQLGTIVFENPDPTNMMSRAQCTAEKLIAWVKSDLPILRIEQNGKQIFTSLGSYMSLGDSVVAVFMAPVGLVPGEALLFILNGRDASVPYKFTVPEKMETNLRGIEGTMIKPLEPFKLVGDGFVAMTPLDNTKALEDLRQNLNYDGLSKAEQQLVLYKRIATDWQRVPTANFLTIEQGGKSWLVFVEECGITRQGVSLQFIAPGELKPGAANLTAWVRYNNAETSRSAPMAVNIQ